MFKRVRKSGFTLVELSISIAFIAVLSISITIVSLNIISAYQRGFILKQVNTNGIEIIDDIRSAITSSSAKEISSICYTVYSDDKSSSRKDCSKDDAYNFVYISRRANVSMADQIIRDVPVYGAFCSGTYSFVWNSGYFFGEDYEVLDTDGGTLNPLSLKYRYIDTDESEKTETITSPKLLKIVDLNRSVCVSAIKKNGEYSSNKAISNELDISNLNYSIVSEKPEELISENSGLALYDLIVDRPAQSSSTKNAFYSGSLILATINGGINISASGNYCTPPGGYSIENFDYCAINKFNFAVRAIGE